MRTKELTTMSRAWEIRTAPFTGTGINPKSGRVSEAKGVRVRYRPRRSRGRFESFVIVDGTPALSPADLASIVDKYNAKSGPKMWRGMEGVT